MQRRYWLLPALGAAAMAAVMIAQQVLSAPVGPAATELKPVAALPISRVILFSSGVAHFSRSAEVEGEARIDLTFPEQDINDLIKSMVLQDFSDKGRVSAVTYDSHEPIDRTLKSFAINLNNNPTLAQILVQARGEKVEVVMQQNAVGQPGTVTGAIIGLEEQRQVAKDVTLKVEILNLWCPEGVRSVKMNEVQRLRFQNPVIENEFRRALETLALAHDSQKKAVSLHFSGVGKRKVQVSYVTEAPIWKTSYRLVLDKKEKPYLQGWAVIENTTDEDWNGVEMALISGRPISFRMDLYNPLYVNRPVVEPELFASLRPPTYSGALRKHVPDQEEALARIKVERDFGGPMQDSNAGGGSGPGSVLDLRIKDLQSRWGRLPESERRRALDDLSRELPARYRAVINDYFKSMSSTERNAKTTDDLAKKLYAQDLRENLSRHLELGWSAKSVATASALGDYFQYVIDQPVNLGRQKSALLPIINKDVEAARVTIYNPGVQARHPLLGLRFKNTTGMNLSQGPITVFEGSTYAGDTRVLDLQPNEERLVSYAIDLGTEVSVKNGNNTSRITKVKAVKGIISTETLIREERIYDVSNRSDTDRTLLIEHPNRKGEGFKFVGERKPAEEAADVFRFQLALPAKKDLNCTIVEERSQGATVTLTNNSDDQIRFFLSLNETSVVLKARLNEALGMKAKWDDVRRELTKVNQRIQTITADQVRIRQNLREVPKESEAYMRYLTKFDDQEKEMDALHASLKDLQERERSSLAAFEDFVRGITLD